ncbi:MAG: tetratricopeptide repeat protein [Deltaproteobacteria bacterium]|jgi:tetratricopeptide (TPR) repeat protein|nr:tetratricopeptide repeat protein [Deltaproteobacteria bacterium]
MSPSLWLKTDDLRRHGRAFEREMARFLPGYRFSVGPFPEDWAEATAQVCFRGEVLGLASMAPLPGGQAAPGDLLAIWPLLVESAIEKVAYKRALVTDPLTGLNNAGYFKSRLHKLLKSPQSGPMAQGLWDGSDSQGLVLALSEIGGDRRLSKREFIRLARTLKAVPESVCLARLGDRRLGFIFLAGPAEAQARLEQARANALSLGLSGPYLSGYALYPQDLALDPGAPFVKASLAAEALLAKAETALHFAYGKRNPAPVIGFGQLVNSHGQITQILPQSRVVINLGAPMGAMPGQVYSVLAHTGEPKGEITVFETGEAYSLAHAPESRTGRLAAGDKLAFSRIDWSGHPSPLGAPLSGPSAKEGLGLESFAKNLGKLARGDRPLAVAVARLDEHDRLAAVAGEDEVENRLALVRMELVNGSENPPELLVSHGPGTLAMAWAGLGPERAEAEALALSEKLRSKAPVSMGVVFWPNPVLSPDDLLPMAQKALFESAMTGPARVTFFGPQTLNISGDHYFDEGDLDRAIEEYQKGLILDPGHLNLLNSLGVCHGRLGDHKAAIAVFDEALGLSPDNLMAHFNKGCSLIYSGRLEDAELSLKEALKAAPDNFEVLFHLGKTALELGHLDLALPTLTKASESKNQRGGIFRLLGQARLLSDDPKGAKAAFKKAVKHNPDDADSLSALGVLFLESDNDREVALSLFSRSVELDPTNSLFRQRLGRLLFAMGDYKRAEHHLKSALDYGCRAEEVQKQLAALNEAKLASGAAGPAGPDADLVAGTDGPLPPGPEGE